MRLSAIFIPPKELTYIFGERHKGVTLNLGGRYSYEVQLQSDILSLVKNENQNFITDFFGNNIALVSAIVGANGTGKTSLLRNLVKELSSISKSRNCLLVYEDNINVYVLNETNYGFDTTDSIQLIEDNSQFNESILYYSPNLDYDIENINSPISLVNYHKQSLADYYIDNIRRHLFFLKDQDVISKLTQSYKDFPFYRKLIFKAKALYTSDFEKVYIQSTLGNNLYKIRNQLLNEVDSSGDGTVILDKDKIDFLFDKNGTIQDELKALWEVYPNIIENKQQYINGGDDFLKNIEVNILSYLVLEDTFAYDGDVGEYPFSRVLEAESFEEKLLHLLRKFMIQTSAIFYITLNRSNITFDLSNLAEIKSEVQKLSNPNSKIHHVNFETKARNVLKQINLVESVYEFYKALIIFKEQDYCVKIYGGFEVNIEKADMELFNNLIGLYEKMLSEFNWSNIGGVLEIKSNKKLSTGEKAILDMYSSIYDYLKRWDGKEHMYSENCILLLDEPEQGYHPLWKKKFIDALTTTLPVLFDVNDIIRNIQVIFTTHDPLTLSDIPKDNIVFLKKEGDSNTTVIASKDTKKTFGANINDLLADSFFISDSLMGDFVEKKINEIIQWINGAKHYPTDIPTDKLEYYKKTIALIEEPIIRIKLSEMLDELLGQNADFQRQMIQKEIDYLEHKKRNL